MKKTEYLDLLRYYLDRFPKSMVDDIVRDYEEHFAIGLENGKTEDEISLELGAPFYVAQEYISGDFDRIHREDQRASAVREPEGFFAGDTDSDSETGERYTTDPEHNPLYDFFARVQSEWNAGHKGKWILIGVLVLVALRMLPPLFSFVLALASLVLVVPLAIVAAPLAGGVASILGGMGMLVQTIFDVTPLPFSMPFHPLTSLLFGFGLLGLGVLLLMVTGYAIGFVKEKIMQLIYRVRWEWSKRRDV